MGFDEAVVDEKFTEKSSNQPPDAIIPMSKDSAGNEIFCTVYKYPGIAIRINEEMKMLKESPVSELKVVPVLTDLGSLRLLIGLSKLPGIGVWFENWARSSVLQQKQQLMEKGRILQVMSELKAEAGVQPAAAKPQY